MEGGGVIFLFPDGARHVSGIIFGIIISFLGGKKLIPRQQGGKKPTRNVSDHNWEDGEKSTSFS